MVYFTSDLHFGHDRGFIYNPRGFNSVEEHDAAIINNWNNIVKNNDIVYVLGDLVMGDQDAGVEKLKQLNGQIYIISGNHDTANKMVKYMDCDKVFPMGYANIIKYRKYIFYISHYPTITSNMEKDEPVCKHVINLFGHTHSKDKFYNDIPFMYNVSVDAHDCTPVSIEQIIKDINDKVEECKKYL